MQFERVSVVGLGYIGLPTAAVLASRRVNVIGLDIQSSVVDTINRGEIHIVEPDLEMVVNAAVNQGHLRASLIAEPADAFLIAVPTPFKADHEPDLSYIRAACTAIAPVLKKGDLVILESTSPVGTTDAISRWLAADREDLTFPHTAFEESDIRLAHCPERVLPGHVLRELVQNDRIIGGMTTRCSAAAIELYRIFVEGECLVTDARTAEMCKLTENSFRDVNIAFANELSVICEEHGISVWELIKLANHHPRVEILQPGPGVGGHCIAVDPWFIVSQSPDKARLIRTARETNDAKPEHVAQLILRTAKQRQLSTVVCLGAAFKPDIDDTRESPAVRVISYLLEYGLKVLVVDPNLDHLPKPIASCALTDLDDALSYQDQAVYAILVSHKEFRHCDELFSVNPIDVCGALS